MGGQSVQTGRQILNQAGIATFDSPDRAVRAFTYLVAYRRNREILYETPRQVPINGSVNLASSRSQIEEALAAGRNTLTEVESKGLLASFGIPTSIPQAAYSADGAVQIASEIGYPVVIKINSPQILHKTEVQGVVLDVANDDEVRQVFHDMTERAKRLRPDAEVHGVTVQPMLASAEGIELIVGAKKDPVFGAVMMVGAGGITAEVLGDRALELPPLNERLAHRMLDSLRIKPLLYGFRGRQAVNVDRLVEVLMRFSYLIAENPSIAELDVNPLLVTAEKVIAMDPLIILDRQLTASLRPYSHLAIRPYPEEYIRDVTLKDGAKVLLRPIRPEDEPKWHEYLKQCSQRSIWQRFRYLFKESTHEMATRFCFVDYDRTMAIVAEVEEKGEQTIVGVARLVANADHSDAEYAILLADSWQHRGLGIVLTEFCMEICKSWGINRVLVETTTDNQPMQKIMRRQKFSLKKAGDGEALYEIRLSDPA
jgi:acetyltransferase